MSSPLEDLKVLDMSRVLAGPFAGRMLCDLGADVVKVEPPDGDVTRIWGAKIGGIAGYYFQQNAGKRSICVDLSKDQGRDLIRRLASEADVVIENFRPGVMERLGVGYESLASLNPALIMLSISGFGADSPEAHRAAYAPIIQAEIGLVDKQRELSAGRSVDLAVSVADTNAALHGLVALLSALHMRHRTGTGQHIDIAMVDASLVTDDRMHYALDDALDLEPRNAEVWNTAAGEVMISGDFRFVWKQLVVHYSMVDPTPEGASLAEKIACRRHAVQTFFQETCADRQAVIDALNTMNLAWGDVRSRQQSFELPTVKHRRSFVPVDDRAGGHRLVPQSPYRFSVAKAEVRGPAPHKGEHNRAVLADWLGLADEDMTQWDDALRSDVP